MKRILEEIVSEEFAEEWRKESGSGMKFLRVEGAKVTEGQIEAVGKNVRFFFMEKGTG